MQRRKIVKCLTSDSIMKCDKVNSQVIDLHVYIEDPYELIRDDYERTKQFPDTGVYEVELSHFIKNCKEANPNYLLVLSNDDDFVSFRSHEFLDLLDIKQYLVSKKMAENLFSVSEGMVVEKDYCMAESTLRLAINMLDKSDIIPLVQPTGTRDAWEKLAKSFEQKLKGSGLKAVSNFYEVDKLVTKIRKSIDE